jgi:hypothetical protein
MILGLSKNFDGEQEVTIASRSYAMINSLMEQQEKTIEKICETNRTD